MTFALDEFWVWDYWLADDGTNYHLFYLHAPKSLKDPELRHRNARIGHATSPDLSHWTDLGTVLEPGGSDAFDASATWTGSVIRSPSGEWLMFYTGARFDAQGNSQAIGIARSSDLHEWTKVDGVVLRADSRWYETRETSAWPDEAWRDPWVFFDARSGLWHMLVTARANTGNDDDRGVIGHATSADLFAWTVGPPLSAPGSGFAHLEVLQAVSVEGHPVLLFSCDTQALSAARIVTGDTGGIWSVALAAEAEGQYAVAAAQLLVGQSLYSGRISLDRSGAPVLLAFEYASSDSEFVGRITDPMPVTWSNEGLALKSSER